MEVKAPLLKRRASHYLLAMLILSILVLDAALFITAQLNWPYPGKGVLELVCVAAAATLVGFVATLYLLNAAFGWQFQFNTLTMLALIFALSLPLSWLTSSIKSASLQSNAVKALECRGCLVQHQLQVDCRLPSCGNTPDLSRDFSSWVRPLMVVFGQDFFADVTCISNSPGGASEVKILRNEDMKRLSELTQLQSLMLDFNSNLTYPLESEDEVGDSGLCHLARISGLRHLELRDSRRISNRGFSSLKKMSKLRSLSVRDFPRFSDEGFANCDLLKSLTSLEICNCAISGRGLWHIKHPEILTELTLDGNPVSDEGVEQVARFRNLKALSIERTLVTDAGLKRIGTLRSIEVLRLSDTSIRDNGLKHLRELTKLRLLTLANCEISDEGLLHISDFRDLEQLDLSNTNITELGLKTLQFLPKLRVLVLDGTKIDSVARARLQIHRASDPLDLTGPVLWFKCSGE